MFLVLKRCHKKSSLAFKGKERPFVWGWGINAGYVMTDSWAEVGKGIFIHPGLTLLSRMPFGPK